MCKFESSQKDESRWQSTDSSKAYRNTSAFKYFHVLRRYLVHCMHDLYLDVAFFVMISHLRNNLIHTSIQIHLYFSVGAPSTNAQQYAHEAEHNSVLLNDDDDEPYSGEENATSDTENQATSAKQVKSSPEKIAEDLVNLDVSLEYRQSFNLCKVLLPGRPRVSLLL